MARGRMLNKKISLNPKVAMIANELGGDAALFFSWVIPHLDRDGRIGGNPEVMKAQVCPLVAGVTPELVRSTLALAAKLDLISVYEVDGETFVEYPKFAQNQQGMRYKREAASEVPENSGVSPEWVRMPPAECNGSKENGSKENGREEKRKENNIVKQDSAVEQVADHYLGHFPKRKAQAKNCRAKIKARLKEGYTADQLCQAIDNMVENPYNAENGYTNLDLVVRNAAQVDKYLDKKSGGKGYGSMDIEEMAKALDAEIADKKARGVW